MRSYILGDNPTLSFTAYDDATTALTISGPGTATVYDGTDVEVETGTAVPTSGALTYTIDVAKYDKLDTYKVLWTGQHDGLARQWWDAFELVGEHIFNLAELAAYDRKADLARFTDADLRNVRSLARTILEGAAHVAFCPRGGRATLSGDGGTRLLLPDSKVIEVYAASVDGTALTATELAELVVDGDTLYWESGWTSGVRNVELHYKHGWEYPPDDVREAALLLATDRIIPSAVPARATAQVIGEAYFRFTIAGRDGTTGIPFVDEVIRKYDTVGRAWVL